MRGIDWTDLRERLAGLPATSGATHAAIDLEPAADPVGRDAAVIVPFMPVEGRAVLLLTRRSRHLRHHPGQISFPGGRLEAGDVSHRAAALRETEEELGIPAAGLDIVSELGDCVTGTGFRVKPFVALVPPATAITPDPVEVEEVIALPFDTAVLTRLMRIESMRVRGTRREFWVLDYGGHRIWGATARMLRELLEQLH